MNIPTQVRRLKVPVGPAEGFWTADSSVAETLATLARFGLDPRGRLFPLAHGIFCRLDRPTDRGLAGVLCLRRIGDRFYLPVNAEIIPSLLDDEIAGLTRESAIVALPGNRFLSFDPTQPLDLAEWIEVKRVPSREWRPLPEPPALALRIHEILFAEPDISPEEFLETGGKGVAETEPSLDDSGAGSGAQLVGRAEMGLGRALMGIGQMLGARGIAQAGARMMGRAAERVPKLTEAILGKQAAAIKALLRDFQSGNIDRALRRAMPLGSMGSGRGARPNDGTSLGDRDIRFSLKGLLGSGNVGSFWFGTEDVALELARQYRLAATEAIRHGDFRRAAYIYSYLLLDHRSAANTLSQGGFHHEAALLFLKLLKDPAAAARAFECAGEFDRAIELYLKVDDHESAGDLYKTLGNDEAALAQFILATEVKLKTPHGELAAGEFLYAKTGRDDLALRYWKHGWAMHPNTNAVACASRMARLYAQKHEAQALLALSTEVSQAQTSDRFAPVFESFFREIASFVDRPEFQSVSDDLKDCALMALAGSLRNRAVFGSSSLAAVSEVFLGSHTWGPPVLSDADFAFKRDRLSEPIELVQPATRLIHVCDSDITSMAFAQRTGCLFVGTIKGGIYRVELEQGVVINACECPGGVNGLIVDPEGHQIVAWTSFQNTLDMFCFTRGPLKRYIRHGEIRRLDTSYKIFTHIGIYDSEFQIGMNDPESAIGLDLYVLPNLVRSGTIYLGSGAGHLVTAAPILGWEGREAWLLHDGTTWYFYRDDVADVISLPLTIRMAQNEIPLWSHQIRDHESLEILACTGMKSTLRWEVLEIKETNTEPNDWLTDSAVIDGPKGGFLASHLIRPGLAVAVTARSVQWISLGNRRHQVVNEVAITIPKVIACFGFTTSDDVAIVRSDGWIEVVARPR